MGERPGWDEFPCVEWPWRLHTFGYGVCKDDSLAHRMVFEYFHGYLPEEPMVVDHLCRNRACVEVNHLQEITRAENTRLGETRKNRTHCKYNHSDWAVKSNGHRRCAECHRIRERNRKPAHV